MAERPYKILGIGSGRVMGNAEVMLRECLMECERIAPVDVRIVRLRTLKIASCSGCLSCMEDAAKGGNGQCHIKDDFEWLKEQILWADAIVFADPSFVYMPTSEVITVMNRAMGAGRDYVAACRAKPKYVGLICVGGSDTVDFNLPMQYYALNRLCRGFELVDQFYANWIRGKGFIVKQEHHLARARLQAKRIMNRLMGYSVPAIRTRIMKLNPMEYRDDVFVELEGCPVCHSSVVHMEDTVAGNGVFECAICGASGKTEHHGGVLSYVWDDDSVAHNRLHQDHDEQYIRAYQLAHRPVCGEKADVREFPVLTPGKPWECEEQKVLALVAGPSGGTSELLARKALEGAVADGGCQGAILRLTDANIHFCTGCLLCKVNARYRGGKDECVLKDDDLWVVEQLLAADAIIVAADGMNGFTYDKLVALVQRFGHGSKTRTAVPRAPKPYGVLVSAFDDQVKNATYPITHLNRYFFGPGPGAAQEFFRNVPLTGDGILADPDALARAERVGRVVRRVAAKIAADPDAATQIRQYAGMCPSCRLGMLELHPDMTVSCALCDAHGRFERRFGENVVVWDDYSVEHSRMTRYGSMLHFRHINYSQSEENEMLTNPKVLADELKPYTDYGKLISPGR